MALTLKSEEINTALDEIAKEEQQQENITDSGLTDTTLHIIIIIVFVFIIIIIFLIKLLGNKKRPHGLS
ncbi:MAG: hypothetical protein KAQ68_07220 [Clostridiales bacterium]|nr:hypothetical protein [Clostridiales bacterium]